MNNVLKFVNNFEKIDKISSKIMYGKYIEADFTISIPIYGKGKYLEQTLMNLKKQKESNLKIQIVISDNKKYENNDNEVISLLEKINFDNIVYLCAEEPLGQLNNFNRSVELCKTDYLAMIHDDDLLVNNYFCIIEKILPFLNKKKKIGMIHEKFEIFSDENIETKEANKYRFYKITNLHVTHYASSLTGIPSCGIVLNKKAFMECGGFNDEYPSSGDAFLSAIMMNKKYQVYKFRDVVGYYRVANNISLRKEICAGFIKEDEAFRKSWKDKNVLRKPYMNFFANFNYSRGIDGKVAMFGVFNKEITKDYLDYKKTYKFYGRNSFKSILYRGASFCIRALNVLTCKNIK